tara:strand:- start:19 stop:228 length:210 start_codon:yes stop_codon:yes gene_type:complete
VSQAPHFGQDPVDVPPVRFVTEHEEKEAERLTRFIWTRIQSLLKRGKALEANSLIEEFDDPPLWDDPLT